jgi:molybdenum cofactor cytidylyltransferase
LLAHAVELSTGVLPPGHRLVTVDLDELRAKGIGTIYGARLDPGDVHQDEAARRIAEALAGDGVRVADAKAGRCDLYAEARGVWVSHPTVIDAINCMDEAIAVATLRPHRLVDAGERVASVQLVPFAIPEDPLDAAISESGVNRPSVARLVPRRAGLLVTTVDGIDEAVLDEGVRSQVQRLESLGCELGRESRCRHDTENVSRALQSMLEDGLDPILVQGACPTVDRADVVPRALEEVGGVVVHLGMPVEPGNPLMLGRHRKTTVLGVPDSARSLAPSGFDDVLQRVVAGLPVTSETIMRMGSGGLLDALGSAADDSGQRRGDT